MLLLTSLAALSLGAAPVQTPAPVHTIPPTEPVKAQVATPAAPARPDPAAAVWKAKLKPWPAPDMAKPADKVPASGKF